jgi:DNA-binding response OmpR family regulator
MSSVANSVNPGRGGAPHILVVEDQPTTAEMLSSYFQSEGYQVETAQWGEDALAFIEQTIPDLVVLDIHLPDMNGYQICQHLRSHERTKHVPIIFLTQKREQNARLKGLDLGAVDYVTKPFDIQELRLRVRNVLQRSRSERLHDRITDLPTTSLVEEELSQRVGQSGCAMLSVQLQGLEQFSEAYGFVARDDVMRCVAAILVHVRDDLAPGAFIGHLNGADLFMILDPEQVGPVEQALLARLNEAVSFFYPFTDREDGERNLPLSISISTLDPTAENPGSSEDIRRLMDAQRNRSSSGA